MRTGIKLSLQKCQNVTFDHLPFFTHFLLGKLVKFTYLTNIHVFEKLSCYRNTFRVQTLPSCTYH